MKVRKDKKMKKRLPRRDAGEFRPGSAAALIVAARRKRDRESPLIAQAELQVARAEIERLRGLLDQANTRGDALHQRLLKLGADIEVMAGEAFKKTYAFALRWVLVQMSRAHEEYAPRGVVLASVQDGSSGACCTPGGAAPSKRDVLTMGKGGGGS